jgi:hypothetical protein
MGPSPSLADRIHPCVLVRREPIGVMVRVRYDDAPLGLIVHAGARDAAVRLLMSRSEGEILERSRSCRFAPSDHDEAAMLAKMIRNKLQDISRRPISGRQVEAILGVSGAERRRWTRAGLLPTIGESRISAGPRLLSLRTYSAETIEALMVDDRAIKAWRSLDAQTAFRR